MVPWTFPVSFFVGLVVEAAVAWWRIRQPAERHPNAPEGPIRERTPEAPRARITVYSLRSGPR